MKTVTAAIIYKDGKFLVARRNINEKLSGMWEFPGGKVEEGETLEQCLEREILEELNLVVKCGKKLASSIYSYEHGKFEIVALEAEIISGKIKLKVHDEIKWVNCKELNDLDLLPADKEMLDFIGTI